MMTKCLGSDLTDAGVEWMRYKSESVRDVTRLAKFWSQTILYKESCQKKNCKSLDICPKWPYPTYLYPLGWTKFSLDINFSA